MPHASQSIVKSLLELGFTPRMLQSSFPVSTKNKGLQYVELAVFADESRQDFSTCCLTVETSPPDRDLKPLFERACLLAAPRLVTIRGDEVEVWEVKPEPDLAPMFTFHVTEAAKALAIHRVDFLPETLVRAKNARQLTLFDYGGSLFDFAEKANADLVAKAVENAFLAGKAELGRSPNKDQLKGLTRLTVQLLAARVLEDKGKIPRTNDLFELLRKANECFNGYFDGRDTVLLGHKAAMAVFQELQGNINFAGVTNEMLGYVYERALVTDSTRKNLNIYYTPRHLAERMLERLPIEELPLDDLSVFDGSCGSGSLLLAAYKRLSALLPETWDEHQRHEWLNKRIHGVDKDDFAAAIAKLSLLLYSLPIGNHWDIGVGDFFELGFGGKASVVVGNPPFQEKSEQKRMEEAEKFLAAYLRLLKPGGLMAIVLPLPFLSRTSCRNIRKNILNSCDILEIWQLPTKVIELSNMELAVLLLRNNPKPMDNSPPIRCDRVMGRPRDLKEFANRGKATYSWVSTESSTWERDKRVEMATSPFDKLWRQIRQRSVPLGEVAKVTTGASPSGDSKPFFSGDYREGWWKWLDGSRPVDVFQIRWESQKRKWSAYPKGFHRPAVTNEDIYRGSKVLVNANHNPWNPWRFAAAVDRVGYLPRNSIWCIVPKVRHVNLEVLAAVLNGPLANLWVDSYNYTRWINKRWLTSVPIPILHPAVGEEITSLVRQVECMATAKGQVFERINALLYQEYGLSEDEVALVEDHFRGYPRFGLGEAASQHGDGGQEKGLGAPFTRPLIISGEVLDVNPQEGTITCFLRGVQPHPISSRIPEGFPGWSLRPGALFTALVNRSDVKAPDVIERLYGIHAVEHATMSVDELRQAFGTNSRSMSRGNEHDAS